MKQELKYLRLFEAFESIKLSKTLKFVNNSSRESFLTVLKAIANSIDFPISKFSDEYFEYLPFKKALDLNFSQEDTPCDATSKQAFPEFGIDGEVCDKGMIKRKWGRGVREAKCPICNGTGVKKKDTYDVKWIKFWFDKDGKYIATSGTDGKIRGQSTSMKTLSISSQALAESNISIRMSDYDVVQNLTNDQLRSLPTGSIFMCKIHNIETVCVAWRAPSNGKFFAIQNRHSGSSDDYSSEWRRYGSRSWVIEGTGEYSGTPQLLTPKGVKVEVSEDELDDKVNPYTWNAPITYNRYGDVEIGRNSDVAKLLSGAHFAIVLNFLDLKSSGFKKKEDINTEREERKSGALARMDNDEIKTANIQRYIDEISKKMTVSDDLKQLNKTIFKFLGSSYAGLYVLRGRNQSNFQYFISYLYRGIDSEDEYDKKNNLEAATNSLRQIYESNLKFNTEVTEATNKMYSNLNLNEKQEYKPLLDKIMEINTAIVNKIKSFEIESIEDMEIISEKMASIRNIYRNSDRFSWARKMYYVTEHFTNDSRALRSMYDVSESDIPKVLDQLNKFQRVIERL
jgi:hypothetical protein